MPTKENETGTIDIPETIRRIEKELQRALPVKLTEIAKILGVGVALHASLPEERPYFGPKQVRNLHQIREGLKYREILHDGREEVFTVVEGPFYDSKQNGWWMKVRYKGRDKEEDLSLRDHNIFPYANGTWSREWIAFTGESMHFAYSYHDHCHHHCCCHHHQC